MPLLSIELNEPLDHSATEALLEEASALVADLLNKPERYMMVRHQFNPDLYLGRDRAPAALVDLKSIGLPETAHQPLSQALCDLLERHAGIPGSRVYLLFSSVPRHHWGHDGGTF